jgi:hypothetical protein
MAPTSLRGESIMPMATAQGTPVIGVEPHCRRARDAALMRAAVVDGLTTNNGFGAVFPSEGITEPMRGGWGKDLKHNLNEGSRMVRYKD